jgi:D-arabinose 1-dehydrogenase-like Zn-dependent alcohol dehydrogenase
MATMRVVQVSRPNGPFEIVERQIPDPGAGSVRIRLQACGICHSDSLTKEGAYPGIQYPRVPGHARPPRGSVRREDGLRSAFE